MQVLLVCSRECFENDPLIKQTLQASGNFARSNECSKNAPSIRKKDFSTLGIIECFKSAPLISCYG